MTHSQSHTPHAVFLSVTMVVRNQSTQLEHWLKRTGEQLAHHVSDYELIVIDNASDDNSVDVLRQLTAENGLPNIQAYALTKEVDRDTACWVGMENALGDYMVALDPCEDSLDFILTMLDKALSDNAEVVFAHNRCDSHENFGYRFANRTFHTLYKYFGGIRLDQQAPQFRLLSRRVVNFILQHPQPALSYRHLPATSGFPQAVLDYNAPRPNARPKALGSAINRGLQLLISTPRAPMRLVTTLSLFGATVNLVYAIYVIAIGLWKSDIAPGWISLSLQQSGMFLLLSLVLCVLGEYILQMVRLSHQGPLYHVAQEFTSATVHHREKLNVDTSDAIPSAVTLSVEQRP